MIVWFLAALLTAAVLLYTLKPFGTAERQRALLNVLFLIVVPTVAAYAWLGNPDLPAAPAAPRQAQQQVALNQIEAGAAMLRQSLAAQPDDPAGWALLASSETALGHDAAAGEAFDRAADLSTGERRDTLHQQATAARLAARYKAGKAAYEAGDHAGMEAQWRPLLEMLPDSAPIRAGILQKLNAPR